MIWGFFFALLFFGLLDVGDWCKFLFFWAFSILILWSPRPFTSWNVQVPNTSLFTLSCLYVLPPIKNDGSTTPVWSYILKFLSWSHFFCRFKKLPFVGDFLFVIITFFAILGLFDNVYFWISSAFLSTFAFYGLMKLKPLMGIVEELFCRLSLFFLIFTIWPISALYKSSSSKSSLLDVLAALDLVLLIDMF